MKRATAGRNRSCARFVHSMAAVLLVSPGCSVFFASVTPPHEGSSELKHGATNSPKSQGPSLAERRAIQEAEKQKRAEALAAQEKAIFDDIERLRKEIAANDKVGDRAKLFAERVTEASRTMLARSGKIDMVRLQAEAAGYLEMELRAAPSIELFDLLAALPPSDATDQAVIAACPRVRPLITEEEQILDFTGTCLDSAGGDPKKLTWPSARRDVAAYLQAEKDRALAAAVAAAKAREAQAKVDRYVAGAVFASGRCRFGNCLKDGWTTRNADGDVDVSCSFSNCFKDGWTARFPDGGQATTRCSFSDCAKDGWTTTFPDGSQATTRCSFSNCLKDGWSTDLPGGETISTRCSFSDCATHGWETSLPNGQTIRCQCNFGKCFEHGASCE